MKDPMPRYRAILAVATTVGFHLFCLISGVKYFLNITFLRFDERYLINKLYLMPFALLLILSVYLYYNKGRTERILDSGKKSEEKVFTILNITRTILIIILPLIIGIIFIKIRQ